MSLDIAKSSNSDATLLISFPVMHLEKHNHIHTHNANWPTGGSALPALGYIKIGKNKGETFAYNFKWICGQSSFIFRAYPSPF